MSTKYPFLDLLGKKLDKAQTLALETVENAVIAAGAGSGKTQVLATRFAWLVLTNQAKADEILTLTFTNKAAAEMYQRIYETLNFFAASEVSASLTATQKQLAQNALTDFANVHIQTLDSYCANIVRQCSNRYGIRPDFSTGSADGERDIKNRALKYTLGHATRPGIQAFAEPGKLQTFANKKLAAAISKYTDITTPEGYFSSKLPVQVKLACDSLNFYIADSEKNNSELPGEINLLKIYNDIESIFDADPEPEKHIKYKMPVQAALKTITENLCSFSITEDDIITNSDRISQLQKEIEKLAFDVTPVAGQRAGRIDEINTLLKLLDNTVIPVIKSIVAFASQYQALEDLYKSFDEFLKEINSSKQLSGNLTFGDISSLALKILKENPDIREQEINSYKKIMIDEFQDNNGLNRDMLYLLSLKTGTEINPSEDIYPQIILKDTDGNILEDKRSPDKLFFVGDEKQSIYKFRGADVSVFNELTNHEENKLIPMTYNYRSTPEVIQAFNLLFENGAGIFDAASSTKEYEAYYNEKALKNGSELPTLTKETVPFHFRFINTYKIKKENENIPVSLNKFIPPEEQIGYYIASQIFEMAKENKNWNDFAILDKSRSNRSSVIKYLNLFNIPYEVDVVKNIFEEGIINDFYNFLRICVYPSDINAYSAYLCSPLGGLTVNSLEIILSYLDDINDHNFVFNPFADKDEEIKKDLSETQFLKYVKAREFYKENKSLVLQQNITTTLAFLWHETGYKYETMLNSQVDLCSEHFDMLFELARTSDDSNKSVSWFIDELENLKNSWTASDADIDTRDITYPLERSKAVQIMSIHKSKGLQFEHVFLCGCTEVSTPSEKGEIFFDDVTGVSVKPEKGTANFICLLQKEIAGKKDLAEFRRLIYVGITRAIKDVYIIGKWNPYNKKIGDSDFHLFEKLVVSAVPDPLTEELSYTNGTAFDFSNIPPATYEKSSNLLGKISTAKQRSYRIEAINAAYKKAEEITYTTNPIPRSCPSALESEYTPDSEDALQDSLKQDSTDEAQLRTPDFTAADFGILVHAFLEAQANGIPPEEYTPDVKLLKNLVQEGQTSAKEKYLKQCIDFCHQFAASQEGQTFLAAKQAGRFYRAEWGFKMFWDKTIWTGSIDLIYQKPEGTYLIVDYKSDEKINPAKYAGQQNCYRKAAAKMLHVDESAIECKLWFMKSNKFETIN